MNSFDLFGNPQRPDNLPDSDRGDELTYSQSVEPMGDEITEGPQPRRFIGLVIPLIITMTALAAQAYRLQVSNASVNRALAEGNSVRLLSVPADRGLIVDDTGATLAQNSRKLALAINPQTLPVKKSERQLVYAVLQAKAGLTDQDIASIEDYRDKSPEPFAIKTNLTKDESLLYREWFANVPGVILQDIPVRKYADLPSLGQILGYVGSPDQAAVDAGTAPNNLVGRAGLEKQYNGSLSGQPGIQHAEVNASGEVVRLVPDKANSAPRAGQTLKLSIDSHLQAVVATALQNELARRTAKLGPLPNLGASAVVMDPNTGQIKAMVSLPDYNSNLFASGISQQDYQALLVDPAHPLLNRTIQAQEPPGSTIKPLEAAGGLQAGVISKSFSWTTPYSITVAGSTFVDWTHNNSLAPSNVQTAIAHSNDVFFYALGGGYAEKNIQGLGIDRLNSYYGDFGLGKKTGVDLPSEASGLIADPTWKKAQYNEKWFIGDTYHSAIGQGYTLATPLQMANATAAIANGGTLWQPQLAESTLDPVTGKETPLPAKVADNDFISADNMQIVREGMRDTVLSGSARPLNKLVVTSAGKTGTAQFGTQGLTHAWYTGFAPYDHPTLAFAILIEGGGESFYSSVPVAEEILRGAFNEPLQPGQQLFSSTQVPSDFTGEH